MKGEKKVDEEAQKRQEEQDKAVEEQDEQTKDDIKDLLDIKPDEVEEEEETQEEEKPTEAEESEEEAVEEETKEEEVKEEEKEEVVEEKEEGVEEEEEEEKEEELDPLLAELGRLTDLISQTERAPVKPKVEEKKEEKKEEEKKEPQSDLMRDLRTPVDTAPVTFFKPEDFKDSLDSKEVGILNNVINQVVEKVRAETRRQTLQDAMKIFPSMMDYKVQGYIAAQQFWQNNGDLKKLCDKYPKVQQYVEYRATEVQRQNPNWTLGQVYQETEKEVRELLKDRLSKFQGEGTEPTGTGKKPALPRKPGAGRKTVTQKVAKPTDEQAEILELIEFTK